MTNTPDFLIRAMAIRAVQGLSVEVTDKHGPYVRHCIDEADRDAYIARCTSRGETVRILGAE